MGLVQLRIVVIFVLFAALSSFPLYAQDGKDTATPVVETVLDDADFDALHRQYLADDALQLERPVDEVDPPKPPSSLRFPEWLGDFLAALGPVFQIVFYAGIAAVIAAVLYFILNALGYVDFKGLGKKKDKATGGDDVLAPSLKPDAVAARSLLEEADALASEGNFSEAAHLPLFRSIEDIQTRRKKRLSSALTAREIGELDDLPAKPREALTPIITLVERSFFGGQAVNEQGWQTARRAYGDFAFGEAWT